MVHRRLQHLIQASSLFSLQEAFPNDPRRSSINTPSTALPANSDLKDCMAKQSTQPLNRYIYKRLARMQPPLAIEYLPSIFYISICELPLGLCPSSLFVRHIKKSQTLLLPSVQGVDGSAVGELGRWLIKDRLLVSGCSFLLIQPASETYCLYNISVEFADLTSAL